MFAVWITGLPASGKSTLAAALAKELRARGADPVVLESDAFRRVFTPRPTYTEEERDALYGAMAWVGALLAGRGVPVIFDATAHRRAWRDRARERIARFLEVHVDCPVEVCMARDPKGLYRGAPPTLPGLNVDYEPPERPDVRVDGHREEPASAARRVVDALAERRWITS